MSKSESKIKWVSKLVDVAKIKPTPKNYKIKTELGQERLRQSLKQFGLAGNVVINTDFTLIDGNSRLEEARAKGEKKIWASLPNRKLTPKEFQEMSAMFDFAKAGEVDIERINQDLGSTEDFYKKWGMTIPLDMAAKMGKSAGRAVAELDYPEEGSGKKAKGEASAPEVSDIRMVQLFFSEKQEKEFRSIEQKLSAKFKASNTTEFVLKALKSIK